MATPLEMLETAIACRVRLAVDRLAGKEADETLITLMEESNVWPWVRFSEMLELEAAGYPTGHVTGLPSLHDRQTALEAYVIKHGDVPKVYLESGVAR